MISYFTSEAEQLSMGTNQVESAVDMHLPLLPTGPFIVKYSIQFTWMHIDEVISSNIPSESKTKSKQICLLMWLSPQ